MPFLALFGVFIIIAVVLVAWLAFSAAFVGVAGAMFFDKPWSTGWEAAWDNLGYLLLFALLGGIVYGGSSRAAG